MIDPTPEPAAPDAAGADWRSIPQATVAADSLAREIPNLRARSSEPGGGAVGSAEREVGRAVYERIEVLMQRNPSPASSDWVELDYLSHLAESVEEIDGYDGPLTPLATTPHPGASSSEPADARGGEVALSLGKHWWNPENDEAGFTHWMDAFEDATYSGHDHQPIRLERAAKLPDVWAARFDLDTDGDGEVDDHEVRLFATKDEAEAALSAKGDE